MSNEKTELVPLFGEVVVATPERGMAAPGTMEQMRVWAEAFEAWIGSRAANTQRAYRKAWENLLAFTSKSPWQIGRAEVQDWVKGMRESGLSAATVAQRIAGVSSFYEFAINDYSFVLADGRNVPLHNFNPAGGKKLRPKVNPYGKSTHLGPRETKALLRVIRRDTVRGLWEYALIKGYIYTMRRNTEWRTIRWGDIDQSGDKVHYRWSGKGKVDQRYEMPATVWDAVVAYLKAAGRWGKMEDSDPIFPALTDRARRLKNVGDDFEPWKKPVSAHYVGDVLKKYCRKAGLDAKKIHVHTLRHTGAMLRIKIGESVQEVSKDLAHANIATTQIYVDHVQGHQDSFWQKVDVLLAD